MYCTEFINAFEFYKKYLKAKLKPQSFRAVTSRIGVHFIPYFKDNNIYEFKALDYLDWQSKIEQLNFSYSYKKSLHFAIVTFLNYLIKFHDLNKNVAKDVGNFKNYEVKKEVSVWSLEEYHKFIDVIDDDNYRILFELLFYTGCRIGEILALNFSDLNDDKLRINKTISKECYNGVRIINSPKTRTSNRVITIPRFLVNEINLLKDKYKINYDSNYIDDIFIFGGLKPFSQTTVDRKKNHYCDMSGVKRIALKGFRHTHASILLSRNVPISAISKRLGHSSISITLDVYSHALPEDEKRVLDVLNSF